MSSQSLLSQPHRRFNPLTNEWILVSPHRAERPWQGQEETLGEKPAPPYDLGCYLCPGNGRAGGATNPDYQGVFVFDNDFSALLPDIPTLELRQRDLLLARSERGVCRVLCFSPRHDLTLPELGRQALERIVAAFREQYIELGDLPWIDYVQIFENKGAMMGASNPHPHAQIWANESIPSLPARELVACRAYTASHGSCLLCDYLDLELEQAQRVVCSNEEFVALVPFWAVWPYEVLLVSRKHVGSLPDFSAAEAAALADILKRMTSRFDNLFRASFPYSMGFHQRPTDGRAYPEHHFHAHFLPPLLRSAVVRKFMVGYELLAEPQRDITPESAAERLRNVADIHIKATRSREAAG
jgi:UDPglucose--hexose-1-phosphate uridylyltransferase